MRAFAAGGTPMGVLVSEGRIASDVAAGADAVLELIRSATVSPARRERSLMGNWFDEAARGLAAGTYSRRDVLRVGGRTAGGALVAALTIPLTAVASRTICPDGHHCGGKTKCCGRDCCDNSSETCCGGKCFPVAHGICCKDDCCDPGSEQCCEGRCVAKERTCCQGHIANLGEELCKPNEACCREASRGVCYDPDKETCCFPGRLCAHGQCCGYSGECCEQKYCCDDRICCGKDKPQCCDGTCCGADDTCLQTTHGRRCCGPGQVWCGGQCCNKLDCLGDICEGSGSTCVDNCPPDYKCCAGSCTNTKLASTGYYNTICCQPTPTSPNGVTIGCNQLRGVTGSGCRGGVGGCICANGSFCPATQQCCYESGCCPPGQSCGIFTHKCF